MRIVFFGTPRFAVSTLERLLASPDRLTVVGVVTQPDRPRGRGQKVSASPIKQLAERHGLPVLQPQKMKAPDFLEALTGAQPDLGVVAAYGRLLPDPLLALPRLGMINVHASLLPKYRGAAPIQRAVIAGETETGITIIRLVREMDAGPMLRWASHPIGPDDTSADVERALADLGADLLMASVSDLALGRAWEHPQDHDQATLAPRITRQDGLVNWANAAQAVHNQVRGLHPWPHAYSYLEGRRYLILRTAVVDPDRSDPASSALPPGAVLEAAKDRLIVACGSGTALALLELQPEGGRALATREFLAGRRVKPGALFRTGAS